MVMFAFRMVMIARVGDQVYGDEQDHFTCNTEQPGCTQVSFTSFWLKKNLSNLWMRFHWLKGLFQVCYSRFSPISHLRFWSVMVIVPATPPITFLAYATNIITRHARKKEEAEYARIRQKEDKNHNLRERQPTSRYLKNLRKRSKNEKLHSKKRSEKNPKEEALQSRLGFKFFSGPGQNCPKNDNHKNKKVTLWWCL